MSNWRRRMIERRGIARPNQRIIFSPLSPSITFSINSTIHHKQISVNSIPSPRLPGTFLWPIHLNSSDLILILAFLLLPFLLPAFLFFPFLLLYFLLLLNPLHPFLPPPNFRKFLIWNVLSDLWAGLSVIVLRCLWSTYSQGSIWAVPRLYVHHRT